MTLTLTLSDSIAEFLRREILEGERAPGTKLPTEEQLAARHEVSRGTVRKAYGRLIAEGLVVSQGTRGHFVRSVRTWEPILFRMSDPENNISTDDGPQDVWSRCVRDQGREPTEDIRTEVVFADARARRFLQLSGPAPLLARRRFRYVDGEPSMTADSFYLREHVAGTAVELPAQVRPGVYAVFAERGLPWIRTDNHVSARAPSRDEARELRISTGTPVMEVIRVSYTEPSLPVRMTAFILPADRYQALWEQREE